MNKKVLTICLSVLLICSVTWIAGCEKKVDHSGHDHAEGDHRAAKVAEAVDEAPKACCGDDPSKCCGAKAATEVEDAVKACPVGCTKPCCAVEDGEEAKACPADCTKPCCTKT